MSQSKIAIVGGAGFVGQNLSIALAKKGHHLLIIDSSDCPKELENLNGSVYRKVNITDKCGLNLEFANFLPSLVVHLASMGMSGSSMLSPLCKVVNVDGTASLIDICVAQNVSNFIYTSSYNAVFGGEEIINGDENTPYFPIHKHCDQYSPTKALAEQLVLKANGSKLTNGTQLRTSCIRPAAIYGEQEKRHLPRIVKHMDNGLFIFRIGKATVDWVDIDNLVIVCED
jgi:nucleoside-diphosphate-sugar epimerase